MHYIEYNGHLYRSWRQACKLLDINYNNFRRLCRHYVRADKNPTIAIDWLKGNQTRAVNEAKTFKHADDVFRQNERRWERIEEQSECFNKLLE